MASHYFSPTPHSLTNECALDVLSLPAWQALLQTLGAQTADASALHTALLGAYAAPSRHYHTQQHLRHCLEQLWQYRSLATRADEVAIGLWFHDAVYNPHNGDNEARSAFWAEQALAALGIAPTIINRVVGMILATQQHASTSDVDTALLLDLDLSILASPAAEFAAYEQAIAQEYAWVPPALYRQERARFLRVLLERPQLYQTPALVAQWEAAARANLAQALQWLSHCNG